LILCLCSARGDHYGTYAWDGGSVDFSIELVGGSYQIIVQQVTGTGTYTANGDGPYSVGQQIGWSSASGALTIAGSNSEGVLKGTASFNGDGVTQAESRNVNLVNDGPLTRTFEVLGQDSQGGWHVVGSFTVDPYSSRRVEVTNDGTVARFEVWEVWDGVRVEAVDAWEYTGANVDPVSPLPSNPPANPSGTNTTGGGASGSTVTPSAPPGSTGGTAITNPGDVQGIVRGLGDMSFTESNGTEIPVGDGDDAVAVAEGVEAALADTEGFLRTVTWSWPTAAAVDYDYSFSITFPVMGAMSFDIDFTPWQSCIELFRGFIKACLAVGLVVAVVSRVRSMFAG